MFVSNTRSSFPNGCHIRPARFCHNWNVYLTRLTRGEDIVFEKKLLLNPRSGISQL